MSYQAVICPVVNIRDHSNADRLNIGTAAGYQVIISKDVEEGTLGVFFPEDGQLSEELCRENNLYSKKEMNRDPNKGGFFDSNRRVKAQRFRGEKSMGFWTELSVFDYLGFIEEDFRDRDFITELDGKLICNKYYTPATQQALNRQKNGKQSKRSELKERFPHFAMHYDTKQMRMLIGSIPHGSILYFSEKVHGTSARTGRLICEKQLTSFQKFWNKFIGKKYESEEYKYVSGSRRITLKQTEHNAHEMRHVIHNRIKDLGLFKGETLYYELVGYDHNNRAIMDSHGIEDKKLKKKYGNEMRYTYGCSPGEYRIYIYRITYTTPDGQVVEAPLHRVIDRCTQLGLEAVPILLGPVVYNGQPDQLLERCEALSQGSSVLDDKHIREGVVVKVESLKMEEGLKYKSYWFCELENIRKNCDDYVDIEDVE